MEMPATFDLKQMSRPEKVRLMEEIWQDLSAHEQEVESPSWHGEIIAERTAKVEEGKATFLTLEELQARLATRSS
jgi:putative addiction module component (TIGR02574 family)